MSFTWFHSPNSAAKQCSFSIYVIHLLGRFVFEDGVEIEQWTCGNQDTHDSRDAPGNQQGLLGLEDAQHRGLEDVEDSLQINQKHFFNVSITIFL